MLPYSLSNSTRHLRLGKKKESHERLAAAQIMARLSFAARDAGTNRQRGMRAAGENLVLLILMRGVACLVINAAQRHRGPRLSAGETDIGDKSGLS